MPIYRRVPKRGFTNARFRTDYTIINVDELNVFDDGDDGRPGRRSSRTGLVSLSTPLLKVLGDGELTAPADRARQKFSASAREKIEAAGGTVVELDPQRP